MKTFTHKEDTKHKTLLTLRFRCKYLDVTWIQCGYNVNTHVSLNQALNEQDHEERQLFCQWAVQQIQNDENFLKSAPDF